MRLLSLLVAGVMALVLGAATPAQAQVPPTDGACATAFVGSGTCQFVYDGHSPISFSATAVGGTPYAMVTTVSGAPLFSTFESGQLGVYGWFSGEAQPKYRSGSKTVTVKPGTVLVCKAGMFFGLGAGTVSCGL